MPLIIETKKAFITPEVFFYEKIQSIVFHTLSKIKT